MSKKNQKNSFDISKYKLLHDNVLVEAIQEEEMSGGIHKPAQYEDKPEFGRVVSLGQGINSDPEVSVLKIGQSVVFNKYSTTKFRVDGKDYYIVRYEDIVGSL